MELTQQEIEVLKSLAARTYIYVAQDMPLSPLKSREEAFELACDADRLRDFSSSPAEKAVADKFYNELTHEEQNALCPILFPSERYE